MLCLEPDYLEKFICDGQRCGAQCCQLWTVFVDEETYEKYGALPADEREALRSHLKEEPEGEEKYAWDFGEGKVCHFLREDSLCGVQRELGEEFLGNTCAIYPRKPVDIGGSFQMSLSLSCPLAAELALFRDTPVEFKWRERDASRPSFWQEIACQKGEEGVAASCLLLQDTGLNILQLKIPLLEKLSTLLAYLREADQAVEAGDFEKLLALSDDYSHGGGEREKGLSWELDEHFPGLRETLAVPESRNQHLKALHPIKTGEALPPLELMLENILVSEYFVELFPCTLDGTLRHNGRAFLALALLYREAIERSQGNASEIVYNINRISTLMGHDREWQETLSQNV
ncbi:MAG: flagellin lysine-N-methylase [Selenomonas sp.]|nr:flagellin lysine-N-methylase [Selenomonas sp.]